MKTVRCPHQALRTALAALSVAALVAASSGAPGSAAADRAQDAREDQPVPVKPETLAAAGSERSSAYDQLLRERGIEPTPQGLVDYLRALHPSTEERAEQLRLIERLSSPAFQEREAASHALASLPSPPADALARAASSTDREVRWRAKRILAASDRSAVLFAVLRSIPLKPAEGTVPELLAAIPLCDRPHLRSAARDALAAVARPHDAPLLRRALGDADPEIRAVAAVTLGGVAGREALEDLVVLLEEPRQPEAVLLAAARALGDLGDRRSLPVLVQLLASDDLSIRVAAAGTLRGLTGETFQFTPYAESGRRQAAIDQWRTWLQTQGASARLRFPVPRGEGSDSFLGGHTLLAFGYQNKVVELDTDHRPVWEHSVRGAFSAEKLANGNVLMAAFGPNRVLEVDPHGQVVWEYADQPCLNARLLPNGHVLIAGHTSRKALEVTREKQVVWEYSAPQHCYDAHRLPDGNTLLAVGQEVLEVSPEGNVLWSYRARGSVYGIQPLPTGNILLADASRGAIELTRDRQTVWEFAEASTFDVFRLPDGNTLVSSNKRFLEVTPAGRVEWELAGGGYGRARR